MHFSKCWWNTTLFMLIVMEGTSMWGSSPMLNGIGSSRICLRICRIWSFHTWFRFRLTRPCSRNLLKRIISTTKMYMQSSKTPSPMCKSPYSMLGWLLTLMRRRRSPSGIFSRKLSKATPNNVPKWYITYQSMETNN
jgi:hypothetical protein